MNRRKLRLYLFTLFFALTVPSLGVAQDDSKPDRTTAPDFKWRASIFGGPWAKQTLGDIFTFDASYSEGNYVAAGALAREIYRYKHYAALELEGLVAYHFGTDLDHWEFVGDLMGRWLAFPWNKYLRTTAAIGGGLSYYTAVSQIEFDNDEDAQRLLFYMGLELTLGLPQLPRWDLMLRIHHRSSLNEMLGASGSNYVCGGLSFAF